MKIKPLGELVLIRPKKAEERTKSGLYLPKTTNNEKKEGTVVDVGQDRNGKPLPVARGDHILYGGYSSEEFEANGEKFLIIEFKDIIAKIEQ